MSVNFTTADRIGSIGGYIGGISTLLGGLGNWGNGIGWNNNGCGNGYYGNVPVGRVLSESDMPVSRYELNLVKESMAKDSEIALLKSEQNTEIKIADVYERVMQRVNADRAAQQEINSAQAVYNATNGATVATIHSQVAQLMDLTKLVVPAHNVCPQPMPRYNTWAAPPAASAEAAPAVTT